MSIACLVETLLSAGVDHATVVAAVRAVEGADSVRSARQERNARYYSGKKERLKASENGLKTSEEIPPSSPEVSPHTPLPNLSNPYPPSPPYGGSSPRGEKKNPEKPRKKPARPMPAGFADGPEALSAFEAMEAKGDVSRGDLPRLRAEFTDYHESRGSMFVDWLAAWRTWCRNSQKFSRARAGPPGQRSWNYFADEAERLKNERIGRTESSSDLGGLVIEVGPG